MTRRIIATDVAVRLMGVLVPDDLYEIEYEPSIIAGRIVEFSLIGRTIRPILNRADATARLARARVAGAAGRLRCPIEGLKP